MIFKFDLKLENKFFFKNLQIFIFFIGQRRHGIGPE